MVLTGEVAESAILLERIRAERTQNNGAVSRTALPAAASRSTFCFFAPAPELFPSSADRLLALLGNSCGGVPFLMMGDDVQHIHLIARAAQTPEPVAAHLDRRSAHL